MKITNQYLRKIIKQEVEKIIKEGAGLGVQAKTKEEVLTSVKAAIGRVADMIRNSKGVPAQDLETVKLAHKALAQAHVFLTSDESGKGRVDAIDLP